jgi:protoheme IX farnesyltransferase
MKPQAANIPAANVSAAHPAWLVRLADFWTLTKPEVNFLVVMSTLAGFYLGWRGPMDFGLLFCALFGTLLVASGTGTLNQYIERASDASMRRTARFWFGIFLAASGGLLLWLEVNELTSILALATLASYLLFYTPLKRRTPLCTLVGAFPGAMPPLIGWAAARGSLSLEAWVLYAILFFWQFPHFLAIAWLYREDYSRAGLRMLPERDTEGRFTGREILAFTLALVPVSVLPVFLGLAGTVYLVGALLLGAAFLVYSYRLAQSRTRALARALLMASIVYLPLVFALLMVNKLPA